MKAASPGSLPIRDSEAFLANIGVGPTEARAILADSIFPLDPISMLEATPATAISISFLGIKRS